MQIVDVIPLSRGVPKETLSYFTSAAARIGDAVRVPIRKKITLGIVVGLRNVGEAKLDIRTAPFELRKLETLHAEPFVSAAFIKSAEKAARYFAGTTGSVISSLVPKAIQDSADKLGKAVEVSEAVSATVIQTALAEQVEGTRTKPDVYITQSVDEERLAYYRSVIREQFVRKKSVFFCVPTLVDANRVYTTLSKGIESFTFVIHSGLSPKKLVETWKKAMAENHSVLIIGTGAVLSLLRHDIGTIIIEKESSGAYKTIGRPHVDVRTFAEYLASEIGAGLVFGDIVLRTETLYRYDQHEIGYRTPPSWRPSSSAVSELIHMNGKHEEAVGIARRTSAPTASSFTPIGSELAELIRHTKEHNERMFLYVSRRGLAPLTLCRDCGTTVMCSRCSSAVVLHKMGGKNVYICHTCGLKREADLTCAHCGSWRLTTLGIASEMIEELLAKEFPDLHVFRLDKDSASTATRGAKIISSFYNSPGSVLIGTDLALNYLDKPIENAGIVSLDSLFSIPDFRINEKIVATISRIRGLTTQRVILQTRTIGEKILEWALAGNIIEYWKREIAERKELDYPPFKLFIKITCEGDRERVKGEMDNIKEILKPFELTVFPAFVETVRGKFALHGLLKLVPKEWPNEELLEKLHSLPPSISVTVDPENIL